MKGKITEDGKLFIKRGGKYTRMYCHMITTGISCSHHCPLFGEPTGGDIRIGTMAFLTEEMAESYLTEVSAINPEIKEVPPNMFNENRWQATYGIKKRVMLHLCHRVLEFDELIDEREGVNHE